LDSGIQEILMKAGFIGLGKIGKPIARHLIDAGVELTVYNRTTEKAAGLSAAIAESPAQVCENDTVFLCLFDSDAVEEVFTGDGGLLEADLSGKVIVDLTTNHFSEAENFHDRVAVLGGSYLETPVIGSVVPASSGQLTILVSGGEDTFNMTLPFLKIVGKKIFYLGEPGLASRMKLINNMVLGSFMTALAEALAFGEIAGFEKNRVLEILESGAGSSMLLNAKREKLLEEDFSPHFSVSAILKDLHYVQDLARQLGRPLFTGTMAEELFAAAVSKGMGDRDLSAVYEVLKK
jgi:3-hydroxyisobutyrate dehydrogenase